MTVTADHVPGLRAAAKYLRAVEDDSDAPDFFDELGDDR